MADPCIVDTNLEKKGINYILLSEKKIVWLEERHLLLASGQAELSNSFTLLYPTPPSPSACPSKRTQNILMLKDGSILHCNVDKDVFVLEGVWRAGSSQDSMSNKTSSSLPWQLFIPSLNVSSNRCGFFFFFTETP